MDNPHWEKFKAFAKLKTKEQVFLIEYFQNGFNGTRAAITAGYSESSARSEASKLLTKHNIIAARNEALDAIGITPERIKLALAEMAFGNDVAEFSDIAGGESLKEARKRGVNTALVKKLKTRFEAVGRGEEATLYQVQELELYDRLSALEKLAKIRGMFVDVIKQDVDLKMYGQEAPIEEV